MDNPFCSQLSSAANESLFGTAGQASVYFLLEYTRVWEDKALEKSIIPEEVRLHLQGALKVLPAAKTLLVNRSPQRPAAALNFFTVIASDADPHLYRFELGSYTDLLGLDLLALSQAAPEYAPHMQMENLALVCTNGRRDRCCARFGFPVYQELARELGASVWECSHIGGHRFAANVFHMPHGILYGRLQVQAVAALADRMQSGKLLLENLRGRTAYPPPVQAAEYYLRQQTGELRVDAYRLLAVEESQPQHWRVLFSAGADGQQHSIELAVEKSAASVFESCALDKQTAILSYRLLN